MILSHTIQRSTSVPRGKIRVLVVDDSLVIRHLVKVALEESPEIEVVGAEANGQAALERIPVLKPDVITLDIEMPVMDGLETLRRIRKEYPRLRTIMFSTLTTRGGASTLEALSLGADDYVTKAANAGSLDRSMTSLRSELIPKIKQFFCLAPAPVRLAVAPPLTTNLIARRGKFQVLAIGVSTGGPQALGEIIPQLPKDLPVGVMIVQHMPPTFTKLLADRLNSNSPLEILEAEEGMEIVPGRIVIAKGDHHMRACRRGNAVVAALDQGPQENSCRPAVDVLFRSLAEVYHGNVLSVVLTGMGHDGLRGTRDLKTAGALSIVQDRATSVVWGMPGAIADAGLADAVLPLNQIVAEVVRLVRA
jgi:two-component system chemotaxis response regulator CheB